MATGKERLTLGVAKSVTFLTLLACAPSLFQQNVEVVGCDCPDRCAH